MNYAQTTWTLLEGTSIVGSGAAPSADALNNYFRYYGTVINRSSTPADHIADLARSIRCGLPTIVCTENHCLVACGYRDDLGDYFYLNGGHGGVDDGWFRLGNINEPRFGEGSTIKRSLPFATPRKMTFVDQDSGAWFPTGSLREPYRTLADGVANVPEEGTLVLIAGDYYGRTSGNILLEKPMFIEARLGKVTINR